MIATDFVYDGIQLSTKKFIICDFDSPSGDNVVEAGSNITFNKIKRDSGKKYSLASATYEDCVTATFDLCKDDNIYNPDEMEITSEEFQDLMRWLNRREFLKFRVINEAQTVCYYNASFNLDKILIGGKLYGVRLTMETDSPFGYGDERVFFHTYGNDNTPKVLSNSSSEIGYLYPTVKIKCLSAGDISIYNDLEDCTTTIKNCVAGEIIYLDGNTQIITTSETNHKINNDFNWVFFRLGNTIKSRSNNISANKPCELEIRYTPIVKDIP